jgi:hypothetical protein
MAKPTDRVDTEQERARPSAADVFGPFLYVGAALAVGYWFLDAAMEAFLLSQGDFASNAFAPNPDNVWMRLFTGGLFLIFGALTEITTKRQARAEKERAKLAAEASAANENARLYNETRRLLEVLCIREPRATKRCHGGARVGGDVDPGSGGHSAPDRPRDPRLG